MARAWKNPAAPLALLALLSVLSLGARSLLLSEPCQAPCRSANAHTLIFDEAYYVNAARVIAGIRPAAGAHYSDAPLGTDPNAEHPQLAKLIMAGAIELFGDGPFAWRIGSLIFGSLAILGMYFLTRAAGGSRWLSLGSSALMAADNLLLVHGRIGTLDIYVVAAMIWGVAFYLRGRPVVAGVILAAAAAFKLVGPYILASLVVLEFGRATVAARPGRAPASWGLAAGARRFAVCFVVMWAVFFGLLAIMDAVATPYADATGQLITGGPFAHFAHMVQYADQQVSPNGPQGIASYPWAWLVDLGSIVYLRIDPARPGDGLNAIHPASKFLGVVSPPILLVGMVAVVLSLVWGGRALFGSRRWPASWLGRKADDEPLKAGADLGRLQVPLVAVAWFLGTWAPFAVLSLVYQRTSYLYYMVIVAPGLYLAAAWLIRQMWRARRRWPRVLVVVWAVGVVAAVVLLYPFVPVF
jgi:hypothetical protein